MPIVAFIVFVVVVVIWLAVLLTVVSQGLGPGAHLWIQLFVLLGFPLVAYGAYVRFRRARPELD